MGDSKIEWTDTTWNPVTGCTKVSAGCANCYAERVSKRTFAGQEVPNVTSEGIEVLASPRPRRFTDVRCHEDRLDQPLRWRKPRRVFVNSMSDLFHEGVPDEFIDRVFAVMSMAREHTFQILTKRPDRMREWFHGRTTTTCLMAADESRATGAMQPSSMLSHYAHGYLQSQANSGLVETSRWPLPNVWLGVSVEDQKTAGERIPILLDTPAAVRFVSYEPALGPVDFRGIWGWSETQALENWVDWLIVGGESGPKARPCDVAWIRSAVAQCRSAGVPVFVKQLGSNIRTRNDELHWVEQAEHIDWRDDERDRGYQGAPVRVLLRDPKGGNPVEWPEDLRVREFPSAR